MNESREPSLVFIGGSGRCGSTLLSLLLNEHPSVFAAGELTHLWSRGIIENQLCGCGEHFHSCDFWRAVLREAFVTFSKNDAQKLEGIRTRYMHTANFRLLSGSINQMSPSLQEYRDAYIQLIKAIQLVSGACTIVDSSKYPAEGFLALQFCEILNPLLIHLLRNPEDVALAWTKRVVRPEITERLEYMPQYSPLLTAVAWRFYSALFEKLSRIYPERALKVCFSDLVEHPLEVCHSALNFLRIDSSGGDPFRFDFENRKAFLSTNHTVSGNPHRFQSGWIEIRRRSELDNYFPPGIAILVRLLAGKFSS